MRGARRVRAARACAGLLLVAGCGGSRPAPPPSLPALAGVTTVLRFPSAGGVTLALAPDSLTALDWQSGGRMPPLERLLGFDHEQRVVYALDTRGRLVGLDLESGVPRTYLEHTTTATVGPDGAVYAVDSSGTLRRILRRATTTFPARFDGPPEALFGAANGQVLAMASDSPPSLQLLSPERTGTAASLPGRPVTATYWGELVAAGHGASVRLLRTGDAATVRELRTRSPPTDMLFSPSGHRLYVLEEGGEVAVLDRFSGERLAAIRLPGPGRALRVDVSGRWMLVRHTTTDSAWVLDLATTAQVAAVATGWRADLPLVAGASTLLVQQGADVLAVDLSQAPPAPVARAPGGAGDLWLSIGWVPLARARLAVAQAEAAATAQDRALQLDTLRTPGIETAFWVQVSSTQNLDWADQLADQLFVGGFSATVWHPTAAEEGYRVVVGPFRTREEAEETGRRLERPFFIVSRENRDR